MNPKIELLTASQTLWPQLIQTCTEFVGKSPTRVLDSKKVEINDPKSLPLALGSLTSLYADKNIAPYRLVEITKCIHFTLIIEYDNRVILKSILQFQGVSFIECCKEDVWLASGTLKDFIDLTVYFSQEEIDFKTRLLANYIALFFDKMKIRAFWDGYKREPLADKTFILKEKY